MFKYLLWTIKKVFFPFLVFFVIITFVNVAALSIVYIPSISSIIKAFNTDREYYFVIESINVLKSLFSVTVINFIICLFLFMQDEFDKKHGLVSSFLDKENFSNEIDDNFVAGVKYIQLRI